MFVNLDINDEPKFVDDTRRQLEKEGLLINQCPHWCESTAVLCACILDAKPAPDCIIAGVVGGDFVNNQKAIEKFDDVLKIKSA